MNTEAESTSIVLVGQFNPIIFHPEWCAGHDVISRSEAEETTIEFAQSQLMRYSLSWGAVEVSQQRFMVKTNTPTFTEMLSDFVIKIFELLSHTPVSQLGINRERIIKFPNVKSFENFSVSAIPRDRWDFMKKPGLRDVIMQDEERPDDYDGYIQARVQSLKDTDNKNLVKISINDHYQISNYSPSMGCEAIINIINENWSTSLNRSNTYIDLIIKRFS